MRLSLRQPVASLQRDLVDLLRETVTLAQDNGRPLPERVHEVRKRIKRARALAMLLPAPACTEAEAALRAQHRALAGARDRDALAEAIARLKRVANAPQRQLLDTLLQDQPTVAAPQRPDQTLRQSAHDLQQLANALGVVPLSGDLHWLLGGLADTARRSRRCMRRALQSGEPAHYHRWRKWMKYHAFHLRFVTPLWPDLLKVEAEAATQCAEWLGEHHDLELVRAALEAHEDGIAAATLENLLLREQGRLARQAGSLGLHLHAVGPRALRRQLASYGDARRLGLRD
jgi:hypothetical protein